jgi:hypothetical protein
MSPNDADAALQNWARWARDDDPRLDVAEPPIFGQYRAGSDWDVEGWGPRGETPVDSVPLPIDELAAQLTDRLLLCLRARHWHCLRRHYLAQIAQPWDRLQPALRAFVDVKECREIAQKKRGGLCVVIQVKVP